uniref:Family with sequence similarity 177 member A1 n=2 Tax=Rhinopithecus TaxID=542827 RepID=A0A2K6KUJ9_RHIBE
MEVGLSAITLFLASASSPVVATTMDQEPVGRVEREAVAASGVAAAAAFGESAGQNFTLLPRLKCMASWFTATSASQVQVILLPQPPV